MPSKNTCDDVADDDDDDDDDDDVSTNPSPAAICASKSSTVIPLASKYMLIRAPPDILKMWVPSPAASIAGGSLLVVPALTENTILLFLLLHRKHKRNHNELIKEYYTAVYTASGGRVFRAARERKIIFLLDYLINRVLIIVTVYDE